MNKLPDHILDIIYDSVSGDSVYWRTEFNKVIQYLNEYSDDVQYVSTIIEDLIEHPHTRITKFEIEKCNNLYKQYNNKEIK